MGQKYNQLDPVLLIIIVLSCILHATLLISVDINQGIAPDTASYHSPALALLESGKFTTSPENLDQPETIRTPGYPLYLSILYWIFGIDYFPVIVTQIILGLITIILTYQLGLKFGNIKIARLSSAILSLDLATITYHHYLLTETLFTFFFTSSILLTILIFGTDLLQNKKKFFLALFITGITYSLATLVRPVSYYYLPFFLIVLIFFFFKKKFSLQSILYSVLIFIIPWLSLVGGWQIRNYIQTGNAGLSSIEGVNILFYRAAGTIAERDGISLEIAQEKVLSGLPDTSNLTAASKSNIYKQAGLDIIIGNPVPFFKSQTIGLIKFLSDNGSDDFLTFLKISENSGPLSDIRNLPFSQFIDKWMHKPVYFFTFLFSLLYLLMVYLFAFISMILTLMGKKIEKQKIHPACHLLIISAIAYFILVSTGPEADARMRIPIMPLLSLYTATGLLFILKEKLRIIKKS